MIPIDLDIDMMRCFVEVVKTGSFTKAGNNIGLTQSGVSVKIRRIEERLDTKIFNRTSKSLSLTHEGEILLNYSNKILSVHDEAVNRLTKPKASGSLRIGVIEYFLPELLPNIINKFRGQFPDIHLEVRIDVGTNLIPMYEKGELDIVVTGKDLYKGFSRILIKEPLFWVIGKDAAPNLYGEIFPLVLLPPPCIFRKIATEGLEKINQKWEVLYTGTSITSIQIAVRAGMGLSVLHQGAISKGLKKPPASMHLPELPMSSIVLITDETKGNEAKKVFIKYLEMAVQNLS